MAAVFAGGDGLFALYVPRDRLEGCADADLGSLLELAFVAVVANCAIGGYAFSRAPIRCLSSA